MWIQKGLKACASFEMLMDAIYFDNITEYDPDVVFYKNAIFLRFLLFLMKPTYIEVLIKTMLEARIHCLCVCLKVEDLYFDVLHVQIFMQLKLEMHRLTGPFIAHSQ